MTAPLEPARIDVAWERLDGSTHETATLELGATAILLRGRVSSLNGDEADYAIECDPAWVTTRVRVRSGSRTLLLARDAAGTWSVDGTPRPELQGLGDVDLSITPATNTLPIRRLALPVGATARVVAAWVRFPELTVAPLEQTYTRLDERRYRYESGSFRAELDVDEHGLVTRYERGWRRVEAAAV